MDRRKVDIVVMTALIITSLIILVDDSLSEGGVETEFGSLFLPRIVAVFIIMFAMTIACSSLLKLWAKRKITEGETISLNGFLGVNIYIGLFITYWFVVPYIGFLIATPFVMFSIALLLGGRNWIPMVLMSILVPILVFYGSNHFLRVFLPTWSLS